MKKYILLLSVLGFMVACSSEEKKEETTIPDAAVETVVPVQTTTDSLEMQMDTLQSGVDSLLNKI